MNESAEDSNLLEFIAKKLQPSLALEILSDPDTCRTFTKLFHPLAQHYIMRLLLLSSPISLENIQLWFGPGTYNIHQNSILQLKDCHFIDIIKKDDDFLI